MTAITPLATMLAGFPLPAPVQGPAAPGTPAQQFFKLLDKLMPSESTPQTAGAKPGNGPRPKEPSRRSPENDPKPLLSALPIQLPPIPPPPIVPEPPASIPDAAEWATATPSDLPDAAIDRDAANPAAAPAPQAEVIPSPEMPSPNEAARPRESVEPLREEPTIAPTAAAPPADPAAPNLEVAITRPVPQLKQAASTPNAPAAEPKTPRNLPPPIDAAPAVATPTPAPPTPQFNEAAPPPNALAPEASLPPMLLGPLPVQPAEPAAPPRAINRSSQQASAFSIPSTASPTPADAPVRAAVIPQLAFSARLKPVTPTATPRPADPPPSQAPSAPAASKPLHSRPPSKADEPPAPETPGRARRIEPREAASEPAPQTEMNKILPASAHWPEVTRAVDEAAPADAAPPETAPPRAAPADAPRAPSTPVREIQFQLGAGDQRVDVRLSERGGEVQVAVRTPDTRLAGNLRDSLPTLSSRLEQTGFRTEVWKGDSQPAVVWRPGAAHAETTRTNNANPQSGTGQESGQERRQRDGRPQPPQEKFTRKQKGRDFECLLSSMQ